MTPDREDRILSRVVDRAAGATEFAELARLDADCPGVWRRLGHALEADAQLRGAVADVLAACPADAPVPRTSRNVARAWRAAGCVVALGLAFVVGRASARNATTAVPGGLAPLNGAAPGSPPAGTPLAGTVVAELPPYTLASTPSADGRSLEVLLVRPIVERTVVDKAWRLGTDERGQLTPAPVALSSCRAPSTF